MDNEYAEYRCSACKKPIKSQVVTCKSVPNCYHPSCVTRHRIYDRNQELVSCPGLYEKFVIEGDQEENMKKASVATGSSRDRLESTGSMQERLRHLVVQIKHQMRVDHRVWMQK